MHISTSILGAQHPNAGQNIQHWPLKMVQLQVQSSAVNRQFKNYLKNLGIFLLNKKSSIVALYFCGLKVVLSGTQSPKVSQDQRGLEDRSLLSTHCQMSLFYLYQANKGIREKLNATKTNPHKVKKPYPIKPTVTQIELIFWAFRDIAYRSTLA